MPNSADGNTLGPNSINGVWILGNARGSDLRFEVLYPGEAHEINTYQIYGTLTYECREYADGGSRSSGEV